jgi:hypothetical protein
MTKSKRPGQGVEALAPDRVEKVLKKITTLYEQVDTHLIDYS